STQHHLLREKVDRAWSRPPLFARWVFATPWEPVSDGNDRSTAYAASSIDCSRSHRHVYVVRWAGGTNIGLESRLLPCPDRNYPDQVFAHLDSAYRRQINRSVHEAPRPDSIQGGFCD